jgi:hypothetical protein
MNRLATALGIGFAFALIGAAPADAQLWFFPNYSSPSGYGASETYVAASYGRGLNETSGQLNAFGAAVSRTGVGGRATLSIGAGFVNDQLADELTLGGSAAVDVLPESSATRLSIQAGIGWIAPDIGDESLTSLSFPIGVALSQTFQSGSNSIRPWVMPRVNITRVSYAGASDSAVDLGASAGVSLTTTSGFGFHAALDLLAADSRLWQGGAGIHYMIP